MFILAMRGAGSEPFLITLDLGGRMLSWSAIPSLSSQLLTA